MGENSISMLVFTHSEVGTVDTAKTVSRYRFHKTSEIMATGTVRGSNKIC